MKLREGSVYTCLSVILFTEGGGVSASGPGGVSATLPPGQTPPCQVHAEIHLPAQCLLGYGQQAGGTRPTGMHSCTFCTLSSS